MPEVPCEQVREGHRVLASLNDNRIEHLAERLAEYKRNDFTYALLSLLRHLKVDNARIVDVDLNLAEVAWSARNIVELRVLTRFICKSCKNLRLLYDDYYGDGLGLLISLGELAEVFDSEFPDLVRQNASIRSTIEEAEKDLSARGRKRSRPLMASTLAKSVGLNAEYKPICKIASKLVHPTALSVFESPKTAIPRLLFGRIIVPCGLVSAQRLLEELHLHLETFGDLPESS